MISCNFTFEGYTVLRIIYHNSIYVKECSLEEINTGQCICIVRSAWNEIRRAKGIDLEPTNEKWIF